MRERTTMTEVADLIDRFEAGDTDVYCALAYAIVNASPDEGPLLAFLRHGKVWTVEEGRILVRKPVDLDA